MGAATAPGLRFGLAAFAAMTGCPALAETSVLRQAVVETFTCANLSAGNDADPEAVQQIARAIALVYNTGALPAGADRARLVLRLCFHDDLGQPIVEMVDYSGPSGTVAAAAERAARGSVLRALNAGTLTDALGALGSGRPEDAVVDLVFGPAKEPAE